MKFKIGSHYSMSVKPVWGRRFTFVFKVLDKTREKLFIKCQTGNAYKRESNPCFSCDDPWKTTKCLEKTLGCLYPI